MPLMTLPRGVQGRLEVQPRWPARQVALAPEAWLRLQQAAACLPDSIGLILTRGYEAPSARLGLARRIFRYAGMGVFRTVYPARRAEVADIFGANGHDVDGHHVDVSIRWQGRRLRLLPLGVFTSSSWQARRVSRFQPVVQQVQQALQQQGFLLHRNATEALQIHCDLQLTAT
ncbi:hypothetical protein [Leeia aquatica]|uniref:hypothetical protein n=1 Tax=Leeia aquatica TaxID=2725557 RepID=UPI001981A314|nr:hypothetical protein [Leeia aquatica]